MIKSFKVIAFWEGISLILLLFFAMPLKYIWDLPMAVSVVGMAHGILFLAYVVLAFILNSELNWALKTLAGVLLASLIPFGTFYMEKKYSNVIYGQ
jgi:integral membrane protein